MISFKDIGNNNRVNYGSEPNENLSNIARRIAEHNGRIVSRPSLPVGINQHSREIAAHISRKLVFFMGQISKIPNPAFLVKHNAGALLVGALAASLKPAPVESSSLPKSTELASHNPRNPVNFPNEYWQGPGLENNNRAFSDELLTGSDIHWKNKVSSEESDPDQLPEWYRSVQIEFGRYKHIEDIIIASLPKRSTDSTDSTEMCEHINEMNATQTPLHEEKSPVYVPTDPLPPPTTPPLPPQGPVSEQKPELKECEQISAPVPRGAERAEQTVATGAQINQLTQMIQQFKTSDLNLDCEQKTTSHLAHITNLDANTIAETRGNWGKLLDLGNGLEMTFQTHANYLDKKQPNHIGIRQSAFHGEPINKKELDESESRWVGMTFRRQGQILKTNQENQHFALELGAPGAATFIPQCQNNDNPPEMQEYQTSGENYVFFTVKLVTGKVVTQGWHLPHNRGVPISSAYGMDIKGFDFTTRLQELEEAYKKEGGKSFYDRPENVVSIKVTPYWGYFHKMNIEYAPILKDDGFDVNDGTSALASDDVITDGVASGMLRGVTVASDKTFGTSYARSALSDYVLPGKSVYIDVASYQVS